MQTDNKPTSFPKEKIKVLLLENIHASAQALFSHETFQVETVSRALDAGNLGDKLADVHVLGIRSKTRVTAEVLARAPRLLALGCFCIGTNQVDLAAANLRGIPVFNAPFSNTRSVAELVICEIIAMARQLVDRNREMHAGQWRKISAGSHEVRGKTVGIVGYGHIGAQVGVMAEMLGLQVIFYDVASKLPLGNNKPVAQLGDLLAQSDFVTLHVPATAQTHGMIGAAELARMKPTAHLLNISRGTVVDLDALAAALSSKKLSGASIDVYPEEPETNSDGYKSPLQGLANVLLTPHVGGSTEEAQAAIGGEVATSLVKFINAGATTGSVNFPPIEAPAVPNTHRILNVHRNVPGVLRDINKIVSELNANIHGQMLATDANIGYLVMDLDRDVSDEVRHGIASLSTNIRTRILY